MSHVTHEYTMTDNKVEHEGSALSESWHTFEQYMSHTYAMTNEILEHYGSALNKSMGHVINVCRSAMNKSMGHVINVCRSALNKSMGHVITVCTGKCDLLYIHMDIDVIVQH